MFATSIFTAWLAPVQDAQASGSCTDTSAWGVKVGADPKAAKINMGQAPTPVTVNQLATIPLPVPVTHRVQPTETTIYRTTAVLNAGQPRIEYDNDTHLAFNDGQPGVPGHFAIAELPNLALGNGTILAPHPIPTCSPFYAGIQKAHQQLDAWTAAANHGPNAPRVVITGVGFFDAYTGQADQSANQIELHSVLDLNINPGAITGRITDSGGLGLAGATVSDGVDPVAVTDSNGYYTIPSVHAGATYSVTASDSGFISVTTAGVAVSYATPSTQNFSLTTNGGTGAVSGSVTSTLGGIAIPGATVTDSTSARMTTTDTQGNYSLARLSPGSHTLAASATGFNPSTTTALVAASQTTQHANFNLISTPGVISSAFFGSRATLAADVNGGGRSDLVAVNDNSTWVMLSTGSGFGAPTQWSSQPFFGSVATLAADVNGDGRVDLVAVNRTNTYVMLSTGAGFSSPTPWRTTPFFGSRATLVADVNGDGKSDLVAVNDSSTWVMLSTGSGFGPPTQWSSQPFFGSVATLAADVNGDGRVDLVAVNRTNTYVMLSAGTGFSSPTPWRTTPFFGSRATLAADVNGDGKSELVAINDSSTWVTLSTGSGFGPPTQWSSQPFFGSVATLAADVNGDHKTELVAVNDTGTWVMLSTGTGFLASLQW